MTREQRILDILLAITNISNNTKLPFEEKLQQILLKVVRSLQARRGSIMLLKGQKALEVAASTKPELIGKCQPLDEQSPSTWALKRKKPLYVDRNTSQENFIGRAHEYEKAAFLVAPIVSNNKAVGVLSVTEKMGEDVFDKVEQEILVDVTGQVISALENERLTQSLKRSKRTLERKNRQLRKLEKLRTDLFNMLIHDLKGPISEVVANLDILTYTLDGENRQFVESAQKGCETLQTMIANLLDIARLEERRLELVCEKIDPQDLVKEALGRLTKVGKTGELEFVERFPSPENGHHVVADRGMLLRVLQNLLSNAIQHSPAGGTIEIGFEPVNEDKIQFFVQDSGPGVPKEHRKAIFEKYTQLNKKADGRVYTTGLGLAFCKMAVRAHKGSIGVQDAAPAGSRFWFSLPANGK
jgi:two-component system sensor histidine kinase KdpD